MAMEWLREALRGLAADSEEQLDRLGTMHPDELSLDFDDARRLILGVVRSATSSHPRPSTFSKHWTPNSMR